MLSDYSTFRKPVSSIHGDSRCQDARYSRMRMRGWRLTAMNLKDRPCNVERQDYSRPTLCKGSWFLVANQCVQRLRAVWVSQVLRQIQTAKHGFPEFSGKSYGHQPTTMKLVDQCYIQVTRTGIARAETIART